MTASAETVPVVCAALLVYYPVLLLTDVGLRNVPRTLASYSKSTGATKWNVFKEIRIRYALPGFAAGLQAAIPVALLGSMLGELTGARWGLGSYLLAIMVQANPSKEWGVFVVTGGIAALASAFASALWKRCGIDVTNVEGLPQKRLSGWQTLVGIVLSLVLWELAARLIANPYFVKSPAEIARYVLNEGMTDLEFWRSSLETLRWAGIGLALGLVVGFLVAAVLILLPVLEGPLLSITFVTQAVPIVAMVPLYVSIFGRGAGVTVAITVSATFFLSFASIYQGLKRTPVTIIDYGRSTGATPVSVLRYLRIPAAVPFIFAAARLATPRVLLGITLAEYLATRTGLGALIFEARGKLDFDLMWTIAICAGGVSMVASEVVEYLERRAFSRFA
jgi:ABC-type nitrate/sulfonate/bicarbonate transport system permease component